MSWFSQHPFATTSAAIGLVLVIGAIFIEGRTSTAPGSLSVWGGDGAPLLNPTSYIPSATSRPSYESSPEITATESGAPAFIPPSQNSGTDPASSEEMDFDMFLRSLIAPQQQSTPTISSDTELAYSFIPQGLVSASVPQIDRTPEQQRLFDYGNDAGSYIQTYEDSNRNAPVALRDQAEDRQDPQKKQAVKLVAAALRTLGESLLGMENVPSSVSNEHKALAESYIEAGRKLALVPDAIQSDAAFISTIEAYNAAADIWVRNYTALATIFSISGVKFTEGDPGSVFTFSRGGGL